ncbi:MAG TPA: glycosyltransferase family 2 protein [Flavobacterium sp.]|nr:glycosyltransferase family 2 protein [Flavobacterium sp.]
MHNPLFSIIIPTYNRSHLLSKTINSLISQTYKNWECIIVDDVSTDDTRTLVEKYSKSDSRFQFYVRENNPKGASHCRNIGLEKAKGDYIIFLDSDDMLLDFCIEKRLEYINKNPFLNFYVFPMLTEVKTNVFKEKKIPESNYLEDFLSYKIWWGIMCVTWEVSFLKKLGGFNINYARLNDPEIHIRAMLLSDNNYKVFNDSQPDSKYVLAERKDYKVFSQKYYDTILLFIPDIIKKLEEKNKSDLKHNLISYLHTWLKHFVNYADIKQNRRIYYLFKKNNLISHNSYRLLRIYSYLKPIDKYLSNRIKKILIKNI